MNNIKDEYELLEFMKNNIKYGFVTKDGKKYFPECKNYNEIWFDNAIVQTGKNVSKTLVGTCFDQVEFERKWFTENNIKVKTFFLIYEINEKNNYPTHTILTYEKNNRYYWFENAFDMQRGIHEYNSMRELIMDAKNKYHKSTIDIGTAKKEDINLIRIYEYKELKENLSISDYLKHVQEGDRYE